MPTQMPRKGTPRAMAARIAGVRPVASSRSVAAKWPTPGSTMRSAASTSARSPSVTSVSAPKMAQRLEHRGEIAGLVIDHGYAHQKQSLGGGQHLAQLLVARAGYAQRARKGFEDGLDLVVIRAAVHGLHVDVGASAAREALKEIRDQLGLQIADQPRAHLGFDGEGRAAAQIDGGDGEGFVHGHEEVAGAQNAALVAERAVECLAERDAHIFDGVVLVHVEIAVALEFEIECAVAREQLQHVIEEADAGGDLVLAAAFDRELDRDARLGGVALKDAVRLRSRCRFVSFVAVVIGASFRRAVRPVASLRAADGLLHLLACSDGDAHAAIAAGIAGAVAHQHARGAHQARQTPRAARRFRRG